jgi:RNA polymerase sigma-70 factor (ECF subfamily)
MSRPPEILMPLMIIRIQATKRRLKLPGEQPSHNNKWLNDLYKDYYNKVLRYCKGKIRNSQDAEDLASAVFVEAARCADRYDASRASPSTWIYAITANLVNRRIRDTIRHSKHIAEFPGATTRDGDMDGNSMLENYSADAAEDGYASESRDIERFVAADSLASALQSMNENKRNVIILSYYRGFSAKEIAERLGLSYTNVCALKSRALDELAEKLAC